MATKFRVEGTDSTLPFRLPSYNGNRVQAQLGDPVPRGNVERWTHGYDSSGSPIRGYTGPSKFTGGFTPAQRDLFGLAASAEGGSSSVWGAGGFSSGGVFPRTLTEAEKRQNLKEQEGVWAKYPTDDPVALAQREVERVSILWDRSLTMSEKDAVLRGTAAVDDAQPALSAEGAMALFAAVRVAEDDIPYSITSRLQQATPIDVKGNPHIFQLQKYSPSLSDAATRHTVFNNPAALSDTKQYWPIPIASRRWLGIERKYGYIGIKKQEVVWDNGKVFVVESGYEQTHGGMFLTEQTVRSCQWYQIDLSKLP